MNAISSLRTAGSRAAVSNRTARALAPVLITMACLTSAGCAAPHPARPDAMAAFNTLTRRALDGDADYVRAHLAEAFHESAGDPNLDPNAAYFTRYPAEQLAFCRAESASQDGDRAVIDAAQFQGGLLGASVWRCSIDMIYDEKNGWLLAGPPYRQRPITERAAASASP